MQEPRSRHSRRTFFFEVIRGEEVAGKDIDILMITYNRPEYTKVSLQRLLETCDEEMRVWLWHNGNDPDTMAVVASLRGHRAVYKYYHSPENRRLTEPTNWLWDHAEGTYLCKVDDDCLMPWGWADKLRAAHEDEPRFGVIGCWRFWQEDFVPEVANKKIQEFGNGHRVMRNCWVEGSGYLMKRQCVQEQGLLSDGQGFPNYCISLARKGWINGWYYPFLFQEHFDDPRSEYSLIKTDEDMAKWAPLSALNNGVTTVDSWRAQLERSARLVQRAPYDPKYYGGWRQIIRRVKGKAKRCLGIEQKW